MTEFISVAAILLSPILYDNILKNFELAFTCFDINYLSLGRYTYCSEIHVYFFFQNRSKTHHY